MRVGQAVNAAPDLADVVAFFIELHYLRGGLAVNRTSARAAGMVQDHDVPLGIDRHSRCFPEMQIGWKLEEVWDRIKRDFRHRLLSKQRGTEHQKHQNNEASHFVLPVRKPNANGPMGQMPNVIWKPYYMTFGI